MTSGPKGKAMWVALLVAGLVALAAIAFAFWGSSFLQQPAASEAPSQSAGEDGRKSDERGSSKSVATELPEL